MGVISGEMQIGNCPVMQELLAYLKHREISADELFEICIHFRRSMVDFSYDAGLNSKEIFDEISYIFDKNFRGILKFYTDTIFQKLIDARQEALQAGEAKEYFLSNMSHEIRTPLNAILGFVNLLIEEDLSQKHRKYLDIIHSSGENLLSIINDILDFSKLRSGEFTIEPKLFSLRDEMSYTLELFVASANTKDITITSFVDPDIAMNIFADPLRIKQILSNFLSNAIKFTPTNGHIDVDAKCNNNILKISVHDNGIGISKSDVKNIFSAFVQAQYSEHKTYHSGTGLGLSICHQLAEHMDGQVGVVSSLGRGSSFWLEIPIVVKEKKYLNFGDLEDFKNRKIELLVKNGIINYKIESFMKYAKIFNLQLTIVEQFSSQCDLGVFIHEEIGVSQGIELVGKNKNTIVLMSKQYDTYEEYDNVLTLCFPLYCSKIYAGFQELLHKGNSTVYTKKDAQLYRGDILVVEDNEANQELIKILLSKYGLDFDLALNGLEALQMFQKKDYDLVLMDEQMPVMDGKVSLQKMLQYERLHKHQHTPVVALTANVIKASSQDRSMDDFDLVLFKPIVLKEIENVFERYLQKDTLKEVYRLKPFQENNTKQILGLEKTKLMKELMLCEHELVMLLELYIKKMKQILPELSLAISKNDYKSIALKAHNIKGASANFRIDDIQKVSSEMESQAKKANHLYDFEKGYKAIQKRVSSIEII
jgi:signal transduction histidine kinase/DNA-binding response OmpR family regulator